MRGGRRITVIGVGNPLRRDDAAGLEVVERARARFPRGTVVGRCAGDATTLLDAWTGWDLAVIVDAARWPGASPGEVVWIEDAAGPAALPPWSSALATHGLGVAEAIQLGRALGHLPGRLAVLAVAIAEEGPGEGLSAAVEAAVAGAADILVDRLGAFAGTAAGGGW